MAAEAVALDATNSLPPVAEFNFAPPDRGWAWLVLVGNAATDAFIWGLPFTFGIFQEHYAGLPEFRDETTMLPIIGTVTLGLLYLGSPFSILLLNAFPRHPRLFMWIGITIISLSLLLASFATTTSHLILTQGIMYALGGGLVSFPALAMLDQWFQQHKGIAFGISWSSTGLSGLLLPYLISWSLTHYTFRTTLRWLAIAQLLWSFPLILLIKPRIPPARRTRFRLPSLHFALHQPFASLQLSIVIHSLGYFLPALYLPSYARAIGLSSTAAAATVALLNIGTAMGSVAIGFAIDRWSTAAAILGTTIAGAAVTAALWGTAGNAGGVFAFALLYGFCAGGATSTWPGIVRDAMRQDRGVDPAFAYALLVASRGVGNLVSGPLAGALLRIPPLAGGMRVGFGSRFGGLIVFSAMTALLGAGGVVVARVAKALRG